MTENICVAFSPEIFRVHSVVYCRQFRVHGAGDLVLSSGFSDQLFTSQDKLYALLGYVRPFPSHLDSTSSESVVVFSLCKAPES